MTYLSTIRSTAKKVIRFAGYAVWLAKKCGITKRFLGYVYLWSLRTISTHLKPSPAVQPRETSALGAPHRHTTVLGQSILVTHGKQ